MAEDDVLARDDLARSPMQTRAWAHAFTHAFASTHRLVQLPIGSRTRPRALATLVASRRPRRLQLPYLWEPGDLLYEDRSSLAELVQDLLQAGQPLVLHRLPASSPTLEVLQHAERRGLLVVRPAPGWPAVDLEGGLQEPEQLLNAGRRSDLRRARRQADRLGEVTFDVLRPTPSQFPALFAEAVRVEAASWKGRAGTALAVDPPLRCFFADFLADAALQGSARVAFARVAGRAVAMQLGVVLDRRLFLLKIGHDDSVRQTSPGQLLMLEVLRSALAEQLCSVEMLGLAEPWTAVWTRLVHPCLTVRYFPVAPRALPAAAADAAHALRSLAR